MILLTNMYMHAYMYILMQKETVFSSMKHKPGCFSKESIVVWGINVDKRVEKSMYHIIGQSPFCTIGTV